MCCVWVHVLKAGKHGPRTEEAWGCGPRSTGAKRESSCTDTQVQETARHGKGGAADRKGWDGWVPEGTPGSHRGGAGRQGSPNSRALTPPPPPPHVVYPNFSKGTIGVGREGCW